MPKNRPRILVSGRLNKIVDELLSIESLKDFVIEYIPDVQHVLSMLPQIGEAYRIVFLSSDSDKVDQLLSSIRAFGGGPRSFLLISLSVGSKEDIPRLLSNPSILSLVPKPLSSEILSKFFYVFGHGGPWNRAVE